MLHSASDLEEVYLEDLGVDGNNIADHTLITTVLLFYVHVSVYRELVSIIVQQDATIYSFTIFLQTALHVSDDTLIHHQEHIQNSNYIWHWSNRIANVR